ncbi:MAG: glutaredoxin family protein [Methanobacteriota archaeon]
MSEKGWILFYTKKGCALCEEARALLAADVAAEGVEVKEVYIEGDPDLVRRYGNDVPVAEYRGRVLFRLRYDGEALRSALRPANQKE